ncbi:CLC-E [Symbiodinium sp. KB8]|nr:CLC-E [Symbiodinium sp. KB8]
MPTAWPRTVWYLGSLYLAWATSPRLMRRMQSGAEGAFLEKVSRGLRVDDHHPPPCREEYTCDADRVNASLHRSKSRIAVYTYNIGGYEEMRGDYIPCVPSHLDAFLFIDEVGQKRFGNTALKKWQERGWRVVNFTQVEGTKYVSSARLTSKSLKFAPPRWLLNGTWHWLVEYDGNIVVDLHRLGPFLRRQREQALVLLNWGYHEDCTDDSFNCFMTEVTSMLTERVQYVARSRENVLKWKELLEQMHQGRLTHGGRKYTPPNYYETNVIFRNLKHAKAHKVRDAFEKTFLKCHEIQRDQFVVPFFLWQDGLDEDTEAAPIETLVDELGYCMVSTRVFSIFGAQAAAEETAENGTLTSQEDRELIEKALEGSKVVASLPGKELDRLLKYFQKVTLQEGDTLMKHGDEVSDDEPGLFVTKSGLLDVYVPDGEGEKKVFTYETSGAVVGELAVLFRAPRAATVKARTDAVLWSVDRKSFEACGGRSEGSMARMNQNPDALLASGAAAGVAAGFNAPIAGIFFASEVVRPADDNQLDLTTRLLAAAVSAAVVQSFLPGGPAIKTNDFAWEGGNSELLFFLLLGVLTGIMAYSYKKIAGVARDVASFLKEQGWPAILLPVAGALLTVALSVAVNSRVQFDGFGAVNEVLKDSSQPLSLSNINLEPLLQERGSTGLFGAATLLVLMATKVVATTFSSATGLVGGTFAPSIYVGACLGGALGRLMEGSVMAHSATTTYIVVGMASMLAANCSVPITSVVLAVELAGGASYEATLPLITGIGVALYVSAVLLPALLDGLDRNAALARLSDAAEDTGM